MKTLKEVDLLLNNQRLVKFSKFKSLVAEVEKCIALVENLYLKSLLVSKKAICLEVFGRYEDSIQSHESVLNILQDKDYPLVSGKEQLHFITLYYISSMHLQQNRISKATEYMLLAKACLECPESTLKKNSSYYTLNEFNAIRIKGKIN